MITVGSIYAYRTTCTVRVWKHIRLQLFSQSYAATCTWHYVLMCSFTGDVLPSPSTSYFIYSIYSIYACVRVTEHIRVRASVVVVVVFFFSPRFVEQLCILIAGVEAWMILL